MEHVNQSSESDKEKDRYTRVVVQPVPVPVDTPAYLPAAAASIPDETIQQVHEAFSQCAQQIGLVQCGMMEFKQLPILTPAEHLARSIQSTSYGPYVTLQTRCAMDLYLLLQSSTRLYLPTSLLMGPTVTPPLLLQSIDTSTRADLMLPGAAALNLAHCGQGYP